MIRSKIMIAHSNITQHVLLWILNTIWPIIISEFFKNLVKTSMQQQIGTKKQYKWTLVTISHTITWETSTRMRKNTMKLSIVSRKLYNSIPLIHLDGLILLFVLWIAKDTKKLSMLLQGLNNCCQLIIMDCLKEIRLFSKNHYKNLKSKVKNGRKQRICHTTKSKICAIWFIPMRLTLSKHRQSSK